MNLFIYKSNDFYIFSFKQVENYKKISSLDLPITLGDFLFLIKTCLSEIKCVMISANENLDYANLHVENKKHHISRVENSFIYLNYSVRNQLKKIDQKDLIINAYEDLDAVFKNFTPHT